MHSIAPTGLPQTAAQSGSNGGQPDANGNHEMEENHSPYDFATFVVPKPSRALSEVAAAAEPVRTSREGQPTGFGNEGSSSQQQQQSWQQHGDSRRPTTGQQQPQFNPSVPESFPSQAMLDSANMSQQELFIHATQAWYWAGHYSAMFAMQMQRNGSGQ